MTELTEQKIAIEFAGAVKRGRRKPIGPLNLRIPQGYVVALVGPNGSGKSTMMHLMLETIHPDEGNISWFGAAPEEGLPLTLRQQIGYVPENPALEENFMTAEMAAKFRARWYPTWDQERYEALMTRFEVPRHERLNRMSKGERRKFEIAAVLAARPKLLLLDEPSSGLDPFAWKDMIDELRALLVGEDVTIVLSTHIVDEVKRLADFIVLVHQGKIVGMAEKDDLFGSWKEVWIRGAGPEELKTLPGLLTFCEDGPSIMKLVVSDGREFDEWCSGGAVQLIKSRSLELDEILGLWIQGHQPGQLL
ncbi:ABC-2 type transport system ATP-binding protein [Fontibacillus phaseoli]|uniref:ABC-2 type transport system ATP-binding protein n=1 Tax=Fontibacillus phaseoli TaxID=1416533 RepID=A0A369B3S8_9BACL|nr:ABC transporter ATP-binding protein [Fontibacillus phaseoli]RCX16163.1 ABC-2 type transport system ATP-binding protein [Fontibacillus phaseoli]